MDPATPNHSPSSHVSQAAQSIVRNVQNRLGDIQTCLETGDYGKAKQLWRNTKHQMKDVTLFIDRAQSFNKQDQRRQQRTDLSIGSGGASNFTLPSNEGDLRKLKEQIDRRLVAAAVA